MVTGLDGKIEAANVEVRQLAAGFGTRHARAAVEWTDRVVQYEDKQVGSAPNAALLEQRVLLFDECVADAADRGTAGDAHGDRRPLRLPCPVGQAAALRPPPAALVPAAVA